QVYIKIFPKPPDERMKLCQAIVLSSLAIFVRIKSIDGTPVLLQPNSTSASASTSANANTAFPGPAAAQETPGFVNNGTVGTYPCALPAELAVSFASGGGGGVDPSSTYASTATAVRPLATVNHNNTATRRGQEQVVYSVDTGFSGAGAGGGKEDCSAAMAPVYPYNPIRLRAPDDSIRATFLPYAATLSELWVKDRWGQWRDVVLGFDNKTNYGTDSIHPDFAPVVGRYANRIKNGTFELDGTTYNTTLNENGVNTLHGGNPGYDRSSFSVSDWNASSVTFKLHDPDGNQGFPSAVDSEVSYTLSDGALWTIRMNASASGRTPIMLSSHVYWQLEAYNETEGATILDHVFHLPRADKYIETDSILIPTGVISNVSGTGYDFRQARTFRSLFNRTQGFCGAGCQGWDTCFVMSEHERDEPVIELWSTKSGIKLSVRTDQDAFQVYTCDGISHPSSTGSLPRKIAHGGDGTLGQVYENHSCVVLEAQDYIDAVNHPEWGRDPIYSAERPYVWQAEYSFSTV
ncbi:unnamed protein product, partial [Tilletia controversa]